jgi:hypothetical protein
MQIVKIRERKNNNTTIKLLLYYFRMEIYAAYEK